MLCITYTQCLICSIATVIDQQKRILSNDLYVTLPLETGNIVLPAEAYPNTNDDRLEGEGGRKNGLLPADEKLDDMYKEFLKIQPGSPHDGIHIFCFFLHC